MIDAFDLPPAEWPPSTLGLVFPNSEGGVRLYSNMLHREYWPLQVEAGLVRKSGKKMRAKYDFHSLRQAAASAWIKQRVDLKRLTTWLGHASVQITLDTYGHLIKDELGCGNRERGRSGIVRVSSVAVWLAHQPVIVGAVLSS